MARKERKPLFRSPDGSMEFTTDGSFIYAEKDGVMVRLDMFAGHYYKLRPYNGVPILEVDGLRMQLVRDFRTPLDYSREVVKGLGIGRKKDSVVLDTCMGLGYTAIAASEAPSVSMVVTCEVSEAVISLARWNPFSEAVFAPEGKIHLLTGSVSELVKTFESGMFDFVIHDPPRFSHAPDLYSAGFCGELFRVLKKGGGLFHYYGSVGKGKGRRIDKEVEARLREAGFVRIRHSARLQGAFASRP
jgi:predicted methyltransferase